MNDDTDVDVFTQKGEFVPARVGRFLEAEGHLRLGVDSRLWRYDRGVYRPDGDTFARARTRELLGDRARRAHYDEVIAWCKATFPSLDPTPPAHLLNVANGLLDLRTGNLGAHDPAVSSTVQLPIAYDPGAACPRIRAFLDEVLPADALELAGEIAGAVIMPANPFRRAVLLFGSGRNGKSVWLRLLEALAGERNVSHVPLQMLAENRFAAAELLGKLANLCGDLDARAVRRSDVFKIVTGGDELPAERKYLPQFSFRPFATLVFSANEPPLSSDQTEAWFDRWIIVPMTRRLTEDEVDPHLTAKLTTPDELAGLLALAVDGLRRLLERGRFALPPSVLKAGERYRARLDTVTGFVDEECTLHPDAWVARPYLYRQYRRWCSDGGRLPVSAASFGEKLQSAYPGRLELRTRRGSRGFAGIGLVTTEEHDDDEGGATGAQGAPLPTLPRTRAREEVGTRAPTAPSAPTHDDHHRDQAPALALSAAPSPNVQNDARLREAIAEEEARRPLSDAELLG